MKPIEFVKIAAIALLTAGIAVGCQQSGTSGVSTECQGATSQVKNAIYAAQLKVANAKNKGGSVKEADKLIKMAQKEGAACNNSKAISLAKRAEGIANDELARLGASNDDDKYIAGYVVVSGDSLWSIAGLDQHYGNAYQWPLIYKANSGQIKDADLIHPEQYLYIPKATSSETAAAIAHAKSRGAWTIGETEASDLDYLSQ